MSSYIPPFATGNVSALPAVTGTMTTTAYISDPTTPSFSEDVSWITGYMFIHQQSHPSWRYAYILWLAILFVFLIFAVLHLTGRRGGVVGAYWSKWSLRRRTFRKRHSLAVARRTGLPHKQPTALPSNSQMLALTILVAATAMLCFLGPDYIDPNVKAWDFSSRALHAKANFKRGVIDQGALMSFRPQYTIGKTWWTMGNRTGIAAFALLPLCILFALKAPPFAIFALPFMIQLHFDKLVRLHRWTGRLIWLVSTLHAVFWVIQLAKDRRVGVGSLAISYVGIYERFIFACVSYFALTLLLLMSLRPIRDKHYDVFYNCHIALVPIFIIFAALHHPPIWGWCWVALALWIGERIWRLTWYVYVNGYLTRVRAPPAASPMYGSSKLEEEEQWEMGGMRYADPEAQVSRSLLDKGSPGSPPEFNRRMSSGFGALVSSPVTERPLNSTAPRSKYLPPPGFAHMTIMPGRTVRVRILTPGFISWAPGQHFLVRVPCLGNNTHPFTVASICDEQAPTDGGRLIEMLIRAKKGWTKRLWDEVASLLKHELAMPEMEDLPKGYEAPKHGVIMQTRVDGAFGSSIRARWGSYSTVVIAAGGSGVSFGISVLQYVCMCIAGRDGKYLGGKPGGWGQKGFKTDRVRFVWIVREFSHVQWCANALRNCINLVGEDALEVNIFVTNFKPTTPAVMVDPPKEAPKQSTDSLAPPTPFFKHGRNPSTTSVDSMASGMDDHSPIVETNYYNGEKGGPQAEGELGHEEHILDYTNFDGDDDTEMPGEEALNNKIRKEGKMRRAKTRRLAQSGGLRPPADRGGHAYNRTSTYGSDRIGSGSGPLPTSPLAEGQAEGQRFSSLGGGMGPMDDEATPTPTIYSSDSTVNDRKPAHTRPPSTHAPSFMSEWETKVAGDKKGKDDADAKGDKGGDGKKKPRGADDGKDLPLDVDEDDARDMKVVSEFCRPGKPKMDRILEEEVERATGSIVVGCCGPTSLNALLRKSIAKNISPARIRAGDLRGSIAFVSEEFEY
ncbi:hypothetical protein BD410DRAFT_718444 [Rickenella mellea]|uniref:ferric-chelate reductase (NADPH) n=1 Tax=Rickenella mellea TaxID=50990 RepID=A0A4Y7QAU0_9AGAM|nr:hypothetical protein BD410DRAFT_718444 [Rickenella mellea]